MSDDQKIHKANPSLWPKGVRSITIDETEGIGIDEERQLYWHGKPIEIRKRLQLTVAERVFAIVGILGAFIGGVATAIGVYLSHFQD